jgi:hypothetical protein
MSWLGFVLVVLGLWLAFRLAGWILRIVLWLVIVLAAWWWLAPYLGWPPPAEVIGVLAS